MSELHPRSFRLTPQAVATLEWLRDCTGVGYTGLVEMAIRRLGDEEAARQATRVQTPPGPGAATKRPRKIPEKSTTDA